MNQWERKLRNKVGELRYQTKNALASLKCETLENLVNLAHSGQVAPAELLRYRIIGKALTCYVFPDYAKALENKVEGGSKRKVVFGFNGAGI